MPKDTPSMAKNKIKRSLSAICDPHPSATEVNRLWKYFESRCAYCNCTIVRSSRKGHLDHLVPTAEGGSNNLHNHALSCARCNGDEKREEAWDSYLERKAENASLFELRKDKIQKWISLGPVKERGKEFQREANSIIQEALEDFDKSVAKMRGLRANST